MRMLFWDVISKLDRHETMDDLDNLNTTNLSTVSDQFPYDYAFAVVYLFVQTPLCTIGMILNVLNICVFSQPAFSAPAYIMMKFLSLADAITLGVRIPQGLILFQVYGKAMAVNLLSPKSQTQLRLFCAGLLALLVFSSFMPVNSGPPIADSVRVQK
ncbi:hypothetical protein CLF_109772 [Clonorchis sinensis]|uniref:G-protein coupled receptors family 1 profile domain-containing protein n=1 Tax=Clonorchis sinensis TaxID=79923 RepID=G7YSX2_CLOSI|nr:hypothetical protein CLF_109772 [Clonorchis sinensis]